MSNRLLTCPTSKPTPPRSQEKGKHKGRTTPQPAMSVLLDLGKRLLSLAFFAVFTLGTLVQFNDPDPEV